ncbi:MinD/ParA family protein [Nocardia sp. NPDC057668]|uniref:MinD/ParA family ATP-binding protein n=1 Tax=Nocardia sp. NPDC057668 TaxID=3346202 RepID=UPI00367082AB
MTTNDQNSTSKPGASVDADDLEPDERATAGAATPESGESAEAEQPGAGFFPPVPDSIDQTVHMGAAAAPPFDRPGFPQGPFAGPGGPGEGPNPFAPQGPEGSNPFAPGGFGPQGAYGGGPYANGQQPGFPPTGNYQMPDSGQFAPPPNPGAPGGFPPGDAFGEVRDETPYGEIRQEIGSDGMVRRVFPEQQPDPGGQFGQPGQPGQFGPGTDPSGAPIYTWSPPPPVQQHQPQQPPPGFQQQGWNGQPPQGFPQQPGFGQQPPPQGNSVNDLNLLKRARRAPRSGWRRTVHKASGGMINPGESPADVVYGQLVDRVNQPVRGDYRIAILSLKGGVGKTTTTVGLGSTFASQRGDRVIAIDANPDLGTLAHRVPRQTRSTVRNLLEDNHISRYSDVRAHTSQAPSRLEVLASEQDPAVSEAFSEADYRKAIGILQQFYNIILTDCGTGLMHSAMSGVLDMASSLVLVTSPAIDGARSASATLDWLDHHGYHKLVERTVVVVNASRKGSSTVDLDQLRKLFLDRTRAVQVVPFDDHLAEGAEIDLELVGKPTRRALLELAAMVADDFGYHAAQMGRQQPPQQR